MMARVEFYWNKILWELFGFNLLFSVWMKNATGLPRSLSISILISVSVIMPFTCCIDFYYRQSYCKYQMECSKISNSMWALVYIAITERLMLWCKGSEPMKDHTRHPAFLHFCRIRSAWLHLLSPTMRRFGLAACLQSPECVPWEQATAEKQVNTDC